MQYARRDLRLLAGAVFLSAAGDLLALITLALAVHELSGSGLAVSAVFATTMVPVVLLAGPGGAFADRFEGVRVIGIASLAQAAVAVALAYAIGDLAAILVLAALLSAGSALSEPAEFALVPLMTDDDSLARANGVVEASRYAGFAAGPALAAAVAAVGDARLALLVNAATFLAIAVAAALIRTRRGARTTVAAAPRGRDGLAYLLRDDILRPTLLAATGALLFISASMTVEVFYVKEVLHAGDATYAALFVPWMLGMVVGATRIAPRVPREAIAAAALVALAVQGLGMASQTLWAVVPFAFAGYAIGGLGHGAKNTLLRTLIQRRVTADAHGRAFAAYNAARNAAELAALGAGGVLVTVVGARTALAIAGLAPVLASLLGLIALRRRSERTVDRAGRQHFLDRHHRRPHDPGAVVERALHDPELLGR